MCFSYISISLYLRLSHSILFTFCFFINQFFLFLSLSLLFFVCFIWLCVSVACMNLHTTKRKYFYKLTNNSEVLFRMCVSGFFSVFYMWTPRIAASRRKVKKKFFERQSHLNVGWFKVKSIFVRFLSRVFFWSKKFNKIRIKRRRRINCVTVLVSGAFWYQKVIVQWKSDCGVDMCRFQLNR